MFNFSIFKKDFFFIFIYRKPWINLINTVLDIAHKSPCENEGGR